MCVCVCVCVRVCVCVCVWTYFWINFCKSSVGALTNSIEF